MRRDEQQALAVTVGLLLLVGAVLMARELLGLWVTFTLAAGVILGAGYGLPWLVREVTVRRFSRQLRRHG